MCKVIIYNHDIVIINRPRDLSNRSGRTIHNPILLATITLPTLRRRAILLRDRREDLKRGRSWRNKGVHFLLVDQTEKFESAEEILSWTGRLRFVGFVAFEVLSVVDAEGFGDVSCGRNWQVSKCRKHNKHNFGERTPIAVEVSKTSGSATRFLSLGISFQCAGSSTAIGSLSTLGNHLRIFGSWPSVSLSASSVIAFNRR